MATTNVEKLLVSLEARTKEYEKALAKAQGHTVTQLRKIEREAESFSTRFDRKMGQIGVSLKGALTGAALGAVAAFGIAAKNAVKEAAQIGDLADKIGTTTAAIQELAYGAVQADMGFEEMSGGLLKFSKMLGEAQNGAGDLFQILEANGFEKAKIRAMSYTEALETVADLIKNARNEQDAMVIATAAFGRGQADKFLEFLKNGRQGLKDFAGEAHNANAVIKDELIRTAQDLDDRWAAAMRSLRTNTQKAVLFIIGEFAKLDEQALKQGRMVGRFAVPNSMLGNMGAAQTIPLDPSIRGRKQASTGGAVKGSITILPDPDADRKAAEAARAKAEADREAAQAAKERARFIEEVTEFLEKEWQTSTKAAIAIADELNTQQLEKMQAVEDSMRSLAELGLSAFERMAMGGEKLTDVLKDVAQQLASAAVQAAIFGQGPLAGLIGGGSGGLFGSLFGNGAITSLYHKGGVVGAGGGTSRAVSPLAFAGAPRMHSGGMAGLRSGEVPAILQKGEMVLPRGAKMGGGTQVTINNYAGVETRQRKDANGNVTVDIMRQLGGAIAGGAFDKPMSRYGLKPSSVVR